jgi:hypothetical protein
MAALGKNHGSRGVAVVPVASDKAVGHVNVSDALIQLDADESSQFPIPDQLLDTGKEGGVAKYMGDDEYL